MSLSAQGLDKSSEVKLGKPAASTVQMTSEPPKLFNIPLILACEHVLI